MNGIKETKNQMVQFVFPEHTNNLGTLHGGRLMDWIMLAGTITSSKLAKSTTLLGATDSIDFLNPIRVGEIVILDSWVEYIGTSSLETTVRVYSENMESGEKNFITLSNLAFVAIGNDEQPAKVQNKIVTQDPIEKKVIEKAKIRREQRLPEIEKRKEMVINIVDETEITRFNFQTTRPVFPEDAFYGNYMSVGKLLKYIDESAAILAMRYTKGILVTGSLDDLFFYEPIRVGEIVTLKAGITYVGRTSLEIAIKAYAEDLEKDTLNHTCTAFLTFIHVDENGKPKSINSFKPETPYEIRLWNEAEERRKVRSKRIKRTKNAANKFLENYKEAITN